MATEVPADTTLESHHDAATKFFAADDVPAEPVVPVTPPPVAPVTKKPGLMDSIVKQPDAPAAPVAPVEVALEPIDKGLQAPPPNAASRAGWDKLKEIAANERQAKLDLAKRIAELETKQKAATPAADEATIARLKTLEEENAAFSSRLKVLDLRSHPEFQSKFVLPAQAAKNALATLAQTEEVEVNIDELLSLKGRALNAGVSEAMDKMTPYGRVKFQAALDSYIATTVAADEAVSKADEFLKSSQQRAGSRSREAFTKVASGYTSIFRSLPVDDTVPAAERPAVESYNAALSSVSKRAEALAFGNIDETGVADLAHKAAMFEFTMTSALPRLDQMFEGQIAAKDARIAELETQVAGLSNAAPKVSSGSGTAPDSAPTGDESHLTAASKYFKA